VNWACEKVYKHFDNKKKKLCRSHPGFWDFGHTGMTVEQAYCEMNGISYDPTNISVLWKAHWSCCRKPWDTPGCTKTYHKGPLLREMEPRKHKWPEEELQKGLHKKISELWKKKILTQYQYDLVRVTSIFDAYAKGNGGKISMHELPKLCDKLKMHLLVLSEDLSNHIRFNQVMRQEANAILDDGEGNIFKKKFFEWWFADLTKEPPTIEKAKSVVITTTTEPKKETKA